jgi:uncharacterized protein YecE (DUF72 family)
MEVRSHTFENPDFIALLRKYDVALVIADAAGKWPYMEGITSNFLYIRLHGDEAIYSSGYTEEGLRLWADRIRLWQAGHSPKNSLTISDSKARTGRKDCFVYFDNDQKVRSLHDAMRLAELLK